MKKKYIQLGAAALLLAVMVAALVLLRNAPETTEPETAFPEDAVYVAGGPEGYIPERVAITNQATGELDGGYDLVTNPDDPEKGLTIAGWQKLSLDTYNLGLVSSSASAMTATEVIAEHASADELTAFGLDNPYARAVIHYEDGSAAVILFGDNAPDGNSVYVKREDSDTVYLIMSALAEPFFKPATAYVNKTVTSTDPEFTGFERISLSGTDYPEPITIERTPETEMDLGGYRLNTHSIVSPIKASVDYQRGMEPLSSVYGLIAYDVVAVAEDADTLELYGLAEPAAVISVTGPSGNPDMTFTLHVSGTDDNGNVRLMKKGSPVVYELPASSLPWLGLTAFGLMNRMPVVPNIDTVSSVKVTLPGKTYTFTMTGESDGLVVSLNGTELAEVTAADGSKTSGVSNFKQFYQTLISASYSEETGEVPSENAQPSVKIEYFYRNGQSSDSVSLYPGPTRRAFISVNNGPFYLTTSAYMDRVAEDAEIIASGEAVKSYW